MKKLYIIIFFLALANILSAQVSHERREFFSESLNEMRDVLVIKPDSCTENNPCPVLIFLPGVNQDASLGFNFDPHLTDLLNQGLVDPMLVVIPSGRGGIYMGNGYWNSSVQGNYADYIVRDLVAWITAEYPVLKGPQGQHERGYWLIGGFSMGGGGAARLALLNPELFGGFASYSGDLAFERLYDWFSYVNQNECPDFIYSPPTPDKIYTYLLWDTAVYFSPDSSAPHLAQFPLEEGTGVVRDSIFALWMRGDAVSLAREYFLKNGNPASSMHINITASSDEGLISYFEFSKDLSDSLNAWDIEHEFHSHDFGHTFGYYWPLEWANAHFLRPPKYEHDLRLNPSSHNFLAVHQFAAFTPCVLVQNHGMHTESNLTVTCKISSNGNEYYTDTVIQDSLPALKMIEVKFKEWCAMKSNTYTITFHTALTNDGNRSNDTLRTTLEASEMVDNFEAGLHKWRRCGSWGLTEKMPFSGDYCLSSSPGQPYKNNTNSSVQFRSGLDLSSLKNAKLTYWTRHIIEKDHDFGYVEASADSGKTWQLLGEGYTGNSPRWKEDFRELTQFCGPGFTDVRIRFRFVSDVENSFAGWFLDDIALHPVEATAISQQEFQLPKHPILFVNYPNPFNSQTCIRYYLPKPAEVKLVVFNLLGQTICTLVEKTQPAGNYQIQWHGQDQFGQVVPSGLYFYRLEVGGFSEVRKMVVMK